MIDRSPSSKPSALLTSPFFKDSDTFEKTLRPQSLSEYVGQTQIKESIHIAITAAKKRQEPLEHMIFYGPPGLGKTTLANIIAFEMGVNIKTTSGPAIEKQGDLASLLTNVQENDILFIDEIHRLKTIVEEMLYSAMEDFVLDIIMGKGPGARTMRLALPKFTLIGATTKINLLSSPLRERFGHVTKLDFYSEDEIKQIILRSAKILNCPLEEEAATKIAQCSRRTPRIANRLLKRVRDYTEVKHDGKITLPIAQDALYNLGIDDLGLDQSDHKILRTLIEKFRGGPIGLNTMATATAEEEGTIEEVYEPFLVQTGFLERTPRGRIATPLAYQHLGIPYKDEKKDSSQKLF